MQIDAPCFACGAKVTLTATAPLFTLDHAGDPVHHCPPSTSAAATLKGVCACGASLSLHYVGGIARPIVEHAHDGNKRCPYCGQMAAK